MALVGAFSVITNLRIAFVWSTRGDPTTHCLPCPRLPGYSVWWQGQWPASQHRQPTIIRHHSRQHTSGDHSHAASEQWRWWCMITMMLVRWCNYHKDANDKVIMIIKMQMRWCMITVMLMRWCNDQRDADCVVLLMRWCCCWWDDAWSQWCWGCSPLPPVCQERQKGMKMKPTQRHKKRDVSGREESLCLRPCFVLGPRYPVFSVVCVSSVGCYWFYHEIRMFLPLSLFTDEDYTNVSALVL